VRLPTVLALLLTGASANAGQLVAVRALPGPESTIVQLDADTPPSFTTLKLSSPPRVVVDLADTSVSGVAPQQEVGDGTVRRIAVADAGAHTARVVIELAADAEFDVRASHSRVEVRIPRPLAVARADPPSAMPIDSAPADSAPAHTDSVPVPAAEAASDAETKADALPAPASPPDAVAAEKIPEVRERAAIPTVALVAGTPPQEVQVEAPAAAPTVARPARRASDGQRAAITGIGFRPQSGGEVIVRSDRQLDYQVSSAETAVLIHLPNARIPLENNRRALDTRFFEGPVERVVPLQVPGGTDVRIELRQQAEMHLEQSGALLTVSFTPRS
jgi:AMIN domain